MIRYKCRKCGATLESSESLAGKSDVCPLCDAANIVPEHHFSRTWTAVGIGLAAVLVIIVTVWLVQRKSTDAQVPITTHPPSTEGVSSAPVPAPTQGSSGEQDAPAGKKATLKTPKVRLYRVVESKDVSIKALTKPLSHYSSRELMLLPMNVRKVYSIVIPSDISREELKLVMKDLLKRYTKKEPEID